MRQIHNFNGTLVVLSLKDMFHAVISSYFEMIFTELNLCMYGSYRR